MKDLKMVNNLKVRQKKCVVEKKAIILSENRVGRLVYLVGAEKGKARRRQQVEVNGNG